MKCSICNKRITTDLNINKIRYILGEIACSDKCKRVSEHSYKLQRLAANGNS